MSDDEPPNLMPIPTADKSSLESADISVNYEASHPEKGERQPQVPVLLLTGYLGSGKTTLVNYILTTKHGYRCAVLLNEIGDTADAEKALIKEPEDMEAEPLTDWIELENGCICCSTKNEMVKSLEALLQQRTKFDYIIIETTGLANPGPVAAALWTDEELESGLCLDAIVTVVDAVNIKRHIRETSEDDKSKKLTNEAQRQIAFADVILLNKLDLVDDDASVNVRSAIRNINTDAKIIDCIRCEIDLGDILHTGIYSRGRFSSDTEASGDLGAADPACKGNGDLPCKALGCTDHSHDHAHQDVRTFSYQSHNSFDLDRLRYWLDEFLWENEESADEKEVYRIKGLMHTAGSPNKWVLQGVHELYDIVEGPEWGDETPYSKIVFIGKNLDHEEISKALGKIGQDLQV